MKLMNSRYLQSILRILRILCVVIFHGFLYLILVSNHVKGNILLTRKSFFLVSISYWSLTFLLYYGNHLKILKKYILLYEKHLAYALFVIVPLGAFYIEEIIYNPQPFSISFSKIIINYILYLGIQIGLSLIFCKRRPALMAILLMAWIFGIANYYVMEFKGNPLLPSDLLAYKTAATVVDNYTFALTDSIVYGTLLLMFFACFICMNQDKKKKRTFHQAIIERFGGIISISIFISIVYNVNWSILYNITLNGWEPQYSYYENGALFTFLLEVQELAVPVPAGYLRSEARSFLSENYLWLNETVSSIDNNKISRPSVIVIMNESFSDLTVLGDFEIDDCLVNWNGIGDFVMRGNVYASVVGGGTCNSEFEFLTGNSLANLPGNGYPYQMYNFNKVFNLASEFSKNGYKTIAIHPANKNNWNRAKVYSQFGFNSFLSLDDIDEKEYIRDYLSDESDYNQVISSYENSDFPVFIFNITMQNHGGYDTDTIPEGMKLARIEEEYSSYKDVIMYLSLIKESDKAFLRLLEYFSNVEEPVIICMFGDHQPAISDEFVMKLQNFEDSPMEKLQKRCCVPYIIWSNYDTGIRNATLDTSLNYLGMNILEIAGIHSPYAQFLTEMQKEIPIINKYGYRTADGNWNTLEESNELLDEYRKLQYYMLFDYP